MIAVPALILPICGASTCGGIEQILDTDRTR